MTDAKTLTTRRLDLIPATPRLLRAETEDLPLLFHRLGAHAVEDWPPQDLAEALPLFRQQLERDPHLAGWLSWYWVLRPGNPPHPRGSDPAPGRPTLAILVGSGGFKGRPLDGRVEIGYYVRETHRGQGYATEALRALLTWAFAHPEVQEVVAETAPDNAASLRLLAKLGFVPVSDGFPAGLHRFASRRDPH